MFILIYIALYYSSIVHDFRQKSKTFVLIQIGADENNLKIQTRVECAKIMRSTHDFRTFYPCLYKNLSVLLPALAASANSVCARPAPDRAHQRAWRAARSCPPRHRS